MKACKFDISNLASTVSKSPSSVGRESKLVLIGLCATLAMAASPNTANAFGVADFFGGVVDAVKGTTEITISVIKGAHSVGGTVYDVTKDAFVGTKNTLTEISESGKKESKVEKPSIEPESTVVINNEEYVIVKKKSRNI